MPITQSRMLAMIAAAQAAQQSVVDLKAALKNALILREQGITTEPELLTQITSAFYTTALAPEHLVVLAKEEQHFKDCAARNDYATNRRAHLRATKGLPKQQHTKPPTRHRLGMLDREIPLEQVAKAQQPPVVIDPTQLYNGPANEAQLKADKEMFSSFDEDELAEHIATERKGNQ